MQQSLKLSARISLSSFLCPFIKKASAYSEQAVDRAATVLAGLNTRPITDGAGV